MTIHEKLDRLLRCCTKTAVSRAAGLSPSTLGLILHKRSCLSVSTAVALIRPWLTVWMDWRTRKVAGWVLSDCPNSSTILGALRHGLKDPDNMGGPRHVWIDNGKDYDAWMFHGQTKTQRRARIKPNVDEPAVEGVFNLLSIKAHFAIAYCPNGKARLERWFRTLETFCKTFDTYTGDSIETKPERLNEILGKARLIPTFEAVYQRMPDHIRGYNARADHAIEDLADGGQTISPSEAYARWCDTKRIMADAGSLDLLLMTWHKPITVGRNGVALSLHGSTVHYGQFETALTPFKSLRKADRPPIRVSYDPHDLSSIRVYDNHYRFVCEAPMNEVGGLAGRISKANIATVSRNKARYDRSLRHVAEHSLTSTFTTEEQLGELAARVRVAAIEPPSMQIVRTPLDGQAGQMEREQLKIAVGAESASHAIKTGLTPLEKLRRNARPVGRNGEGHARPDPFAKLRERNHAW